MNARASSPPPSAVPSESPADALKRRVYKVIILLGLPGAFFAWLTYRANQPLLGVAYLLLGLGCAYGLACLFNPQISVLFVERLGFVMTVTIALASLVHVEFLADRRSNDWREMRETTHWVVAHLCVLAYVVFETRMGLRVAAGIAVGAFLLSLVRVLPLQNPNEVVLLIRQSSISGAMLALAYLLAFTKEQLNLEQVRSSTDDLTRLPNRRALYGVLEKALAKASQAGDVSVLLLDVDHFKRINDHFGHDVGDQVLQEIAMVLRHNTPKGSSAGRWGGEEFLVVLPGHALEPALTCAETLRTTFEREAFSVGRVSASFGVASWQVGESQTDLVRRADAALYAAKARGRNRVEHQVRAVERDGLDGLEHPRESVV